MNTQAKAKTIAALRSGKYSQTGGRLRRTEKPYAYCCLGVMCEVALEGYWDDGGSYILSTGKTAGLATLSKEAASKLGLSIKETNVLAAKNDSGLTFEEIANYIEGNL